MRGSQRPRPFPAASGTGEPDEGAARSTTARVGEVLDVERPRSTLLVTRGGRPDQVSRANDTRSSGLGPRIFAGLRRILD